MRVKTRHPETGSSLLVVLVSSAIVGVSLASYLTLVSQQNQIVKRSESWNAAMPLLEAGIEEALTQLNVTGGTNLASNGWFLADREESSAFYRFRWIGRDVYVVGISNVNPPVIFASGYVRDPQSGHYLPPRTVAVNTVRDSLFARGMVAKGDIDMLGNNVATDSFDSVDSNHSTNGRYDRTKAKDNGDVATNQGLINSISVGNANIYGHVNTGPGGSVAVGPNGGVGSRAWHLAGSHGIQPGWSAADMNVSFPDVSVPFTSGSVPAAGSVGGTNYDLVLDSGNYILDSLNFSSDKKVFVTGRATLYVRGNLSLSGNASIIVGADNASLKLYVGGSSASLAGNGVVNGTGNAANFSFYGLPTLTSLSYSGNAAFVGTIYAPNADFTMGGGGNNTYDFVGASVSSTVRMNGHFNFHYDENLARVGPSRGYIVTAWNEL